MVQSKKYFLAAFFTIFQQMYHRNELGYGMIEKTKNEIDKK